MRRSKKIVTTLIFITLCIGCSKKNNTDSKVVLTINETQITLSQFKDELRSFSKQFDSSRPLEKKERKELKKILINKLIEKELINQEAKKSNLVVSGEELNDEIKGILTNYSKEKLKYTLYSKDVDFNQWKEKVKNNILIEKLIKAKIDVNLSVSEDELREYYNKNEYRFINPLKVQVSQVVVSSESEANIVKRRLTKGEDFAKIAKEMSISPEAKLGGDLGSFSKGQMPEEFNIVFKMKPGDISNIVKTPYGFHIFMLKEKIKENKETFEQAKEGIFRKIFLDKQKKYFSEWLNKLKHNSNIKIDNYLL